MSTDKEQASIINLLCSLPTSSHNVKGGMGSHTRGTIQYDFDIMPAEARGPNRDSSLRRLEGLAAQALGSPWNVQAA